MSDYTKTTNFGAKDSLTSGDPNKIILGSEHDTEYDAIETASATKANKVSVVATTNNLAMLTASGDLADSLVESDGAGNITANVTGNVTGNLTGDVTGNADTATALETSRNFSITGDITAAAVGFTGTGNVALNASIDNGVVTGDNLSKSIASTGSQSVTTTWVPPAGLYQFASAGVISYDIFVSGAWRSNSGSAINHGGLLMCDGTNMRVVSSSGTTTVYYQKF